MSLLSDGLALHGGVSGCLLLNLSVQYLCFYDSTVVFQLGQLVLMMEDSKDTSK